MPSPSEPALLLALVLLGPRVAGAEGPALEATVRPKLSLPSASVEVDLRNASATDAAPVTLEGALSGRYETATLEDGVRVGESRRMVLRFEKVGAGSHPLALRLRYPSTPRGAALVSVSSPDLALETSALWPVSIESLDGKAHAVVVRVEVPKGLGVSPAESLVNVSPGAPGRVAPRLFRGSMPRGSKAQVYVLAEPQDPVPVAALSRGRVLIVRRISRLTWCPILSFSKRAPPVRTACGRTGW